MEYSEAKKYSSGIPSENDENISIMLQDGNFMSAVRKREPGRSYFRVHMLFIFELLLIQDLFTYDCY